MLFKSQIITEGSGSIAGNTVLQTRAGLAMRARVIPTNPATARQQVVRTDFGNLSSQWSSLLSQFERDLWTAYAITNPITGKFGDPLILTGQNMFIRLNGIRLGGADATILTLTTPPALNGLEPLAQVTAVPADGGDDIDVTFDDTADWVDLDLAAMMVYVTRKRSAGTLFTKGPWQLMTTILGDSIAPVTSPVNAVNPYLQTYTAGEKVGVRTILTMPDGKPSAEQFFDSTAAV